MHQQDGMGDGSYWADIELPLSLTESWIQGKAGPCRYL